MYKLLFSCILFDEVSVVSLLSLIKNNQELRGKLTLFQS